MISNANDYIQAKKREKERNKPIIIVFWQLGLLSMSPLGITSLYRYFPPDTPPSAKHYVPHDPAVVDGFAASSAAMPPSLSISLAEAKWRVGNRAKGDLRKKTNPACHTLCAQCGSANMIHTRRHLLPSLA